MIIYWLIRRAMFCPKSSEKCLEMIVADLEVNRKYARTYYKWTTVYGVGWIFDFGIFNKRTWIRLSLMAQYGTEVDSELRSHSETRFRLRWSRSRVSESIFSIVQFTRGGTGQNFCVRPDGFWSRIGENSAKTSEYTNSGKEQPSLMIDQHSNKESKWRLIAAIVMIRSELCLYTNLYKYFRQVYFLFILHLHQHLNGPAKIRFPPTGLVKALQWWVFVSIICF